MHLMFIHDIVYFFMCGQNFFNGDKVRSQWDDDEVLSKGLCMLQTDSSEAEEYLPIRCGSEQCGNSRTRGTVGRDLRS